MNISELIASDDENATFVNSNIFFSTFIQSDTHLLVVKGVVVGNFARMHPMNLGKQSEQHFCTLFEMEMRLSHSQGEVLLTYMFLECLCLMKLRLLSFFSCPRKF